AGARAPRGGPDRLRRRLPRRSDLRHPEVLRLADHRPHRQPDGRTQGRVSGHAEPALRLRPVQRGIPPAVRLLARVAGAAATAPGPAPAACTGPPAPARPAGRGGARPRGAPAPAAPASTAAAPGP